MALSTPRKRAQNEPHVPGVLALASPTAFGEARSTVLLAVRDRHCTSSLLRAATIAQKRGDQLHVLSVLPEVPHMNVLFPQHNMVELLRGLEHTRDVDSSTRKWLSDWLLEDDIPEHFSVAHGDFVKVVAARAKELHARLIVVAPQEDGLNQAAVSLVLAAGVPVLAARQATGGDAIVAATDLTSLDYPVLGGAAELGRLLDARVIAVHNVEPYAVVATMEAAALAQVPVEPALASRAQQLSRASQRMPIDVRPVVRSESDTVDAILKVAQAQDADVVVVGARDRTWLGRFTARNVAARVVDRAEHSVLVLPLSRGVKN